MGMEQCIQLCRVFIFAVLVGLLTKPVCVQCITQTQFNMDDPNHCNFAGIHEVPEGTTIYINSRSSSSLSSTIMSCTLKFRADVGDSSLVIDFRSFYINDEDVTLNIVDNRGSLNEFKAHMGKPSSLTLDGAEVTMRLKRQQTDDRDYNFQMTIKLQRNSAATSTDSSNPMAVGLVVGIVGAIIGALVLAAIVGICCYKKIRRKQLRAMAEEEDSDSKVRLEEREPSSYFTGYTNNTMTNSNSNGKFGNSRMGNKRYYPDGSGYRTEQSSVTQGSSKGDVGYYSDSKKYASDNDNENVDYRTGQKGSPSKRPQTINNLPSSPKSSSAFHYNASELPENIEENITDDSQPKSPFLAALHSNAKFRKSFKSTEAEAEERVKRISSSSLSESSRIGVSMSPRGKDNAPALPAVPVAPKSPTTKRQAHASIKRAPRTLSASSDEIEAISKGQEGDRNIRLIQDNDEPSSPVEMVPIKTRDPRSYEKKSNTQHTLKPQKGRSPQEKRKKNEKSSQNEKGTKEQSSQGYVQKEQKDFGSIGRRGKKSPRLNSKGFGRRNKSENDLVDRAGTPTSTYSRDNLESLPPLQRTDSRQSLYASRSSLYGRRRRKGSFTSSVGTYARDDMEVYRRSRDYDDYDDDDGSGYEKPISRREKERMFRSAGDIGRGVTKSTQTLRETATQTGQQEPFTLQPTIVLKKKRKPRSQSVAQTQTTKTKTKPKPSTRTTKSVSAAVQLDNETRVGSKEPEDIDGNMKTPDRAAPPARTGTPILQAQDNQTGVTKNGSPINVTSDGQFVVAGNANIITEPMTFSQPQTVASNQTYPAPMQQHMGTMGQHIPMNVGHHQIPVMMQAQQGNPPYNVGMQFVPPQQQTYVMQPQYNDPGWQNAPPNSAQQFHSSAPPMQPGHQPSAYQGQPHQQNAGPPQPRKSNWDMLCEITDRHKTSGSEETASEMGSVFSAPGLGKRTVEESYVPLNYGAHPQMNIQGAVHQQSPTDVPIGARQQQQRPAMPKQSSWDALQQLTDRPYTINKGEHSEV
ncbi:hypothetical protein ScPMuIL_008815 [Solemya velum]